MDIQQVVTQLFSEKPKPACTCQISLVDGHTVNEQFEIISLVVLEGLENKIVTNPQFDLCKDEKKFIQQMSILLKLYLASIGIRLNVEVLSKKEFKGIKLVKSPNFWTIKAFKFHLNCLYKFQKKGKIHTLYYNPKSKLETINDGILVVKIRSHCLKLTFKQY